MDGRWSFLVGMCASAAGDSPVSTKTVTQRQSRAVAQFASERCTLRTVTGPLRWSNDIDGIEETGKPGEAGFVFDFVSAKSIIQHPGTTPEVLSPAYEYVGEIVVDRIQQ